MNQRQRKRARYATMRVTVRFHVQSADAGMGLRRGDFFTIGGVTKRLGR